MTKRRQNIMQAEFRGLALPLNLIGERGIDGEREQARRDGERERAARFESAQIEMGAR